MYGEDLEKKRASFPDFMGSVERYILETHPDKEGFQKELKKIRNDEQLTETQDMGSWFLLYTLERVSLKPRKKEEEKSSYLFNNAMDQVTDGCPCLSRENKRFLLVCDGELLLRDLDLFEAIVSVVQLAYLVDMEYPERRQETRQWLQRFTNSPQWYCKD
ncbi:uncharacterized protein LOC111699438 [Eurytemora carolleeae]|uniref:uncharacterized protein LOC111699438 n=1 Tax=Eurytemora carolleeae TaxID=1294199 RepID=UPI000C766A19|nr:uncharacterized protein LOC111699438 [Eurytemora carolleeae]|eukprot:XP_023325886.1 uncharacterized protein LOC111699438 [Eurytemora affinis]